MHTFFKSRDEDFIGVTYEITSTLGEIDYSRYRQQIFGTAYLEDDEGNNIKTICKMEANKLLLSHAINDSRSTMDVFDTVAELFEIGQTIWDEDRLSFVDGIERYYGYDLTDTDVLILSRIELLPTFRGKRIGEHLIRDVYTNFVSGCGLFVLKSFPIQKEVVDERDPWGKLMEYENMEQDHETAAYKLMAYYQRLGFDLIPEVSQELLFINPVQRNDLFDLVKLF